MEENWETKQYNGAEDEMVRITVLNIYPIVPKQLKYHSFSVGNGAVTLECNGNGRRTIYRQGFVHNELRRDGGSSEN
jgi:hypothetical protein